MALIKQINYKGISSEYWCIINKSWNKLKNTTDCSLGLFYNKTSRENDLKNILDKKIFSFNGDLSIQDLYNNIKLNQDYLDATDDI